MGFQESVKILLKKLLFKFPNGLKTEKWGLILKKNEEKYLRKSFKKQFTKVSSRYKNF